MWGVLLSCKPEEFAGMEATNDYVTQRQSFNEWVANYMSSHGYTETYECFRREADFPEGIDPESGSEVSRSVGSDVQSSVDVGTQQRPNRRSLPLRSFPWFLVSISAVQFCIHMYMAISGDSQLESPLINNPYR